MADLHWVQALLDSTSMMSVAAPETRLSELAIPRKLAPCASTLELTGLAAFRDMQIVRERRDNPDSNQTILDRCHSFDSLSANTKREWVSLPSEFLSRVHRHQTLWMVCAFLASVGPVNKVIGAFDPFIYDGGEPMIAYYLPRIVTLPRVPMLVIVRQKGQTPDHKRYRDLAVPLLSERD
jgi:hypothetical protein